MFFVLLLETRVAFGLRSFDNIVVSVSDSSVILTEGADEFEIFDGIADGGCSTSPEVVEIGFIFSNVCS